MESSNLEVFLEAATPQLPWRSAPMDCFQGPNNVWQLEKKDVVDYFSLEDLWEHYSESSAYGLGVPVRLGNGKFITQHFVPYLSAIQIYTSKTLLAAVPSMGASDESDSWSDDDSAADKLSRSWDAASDDSDSGVPATAKQGGHLNFQYSEWDPPYQRIPLADKVAELAQDYPYLTSLKSAQLSPSSWLSVAWYPIYHIPYHGNLKGTCACFLTYHSISSVFQDYMPFRRQQEERGCFAVRAGHVQDAPRREAALDIRDQQQQVIRSSLRGGIFLAEASRSTPSGLQLLHVSITTPPSSDYMRGILCS
ncbi:uncharacterized protein LOC112887747 isoform X2 [Panicum hallii]|uniref:uncharacterized protein LOC112887747 isoform X2 n=1 Tax=Panicum hallii TaxID=206008 RepID=UPI000DF4E447|nr:uncharacterized protein LOC112887747 isoform X2 [Panicum hallii]